MSKVGELKNPLIAAIGTIVVATITTLGVTTANIGTGNITTVAATTVGATTANLVSVVGTNAKFTGLATYANDTLAKAANLTEGTFYKTATGGVQVVLAAS